MAIAGCDRNDCYNIAGFPEDTLVTWYSPDMWGDWRATTWTLYELMQIIYSNRVYLPSINSGEYAQIQRMVDTEFTTPYNPKVWEITLDNGKSWKCCEDHQVLSFYDLVGPKQGLMVSHYATQNGAIIKRMTRKEITPKYKAKFWINLVTVDDKPFILNDDGILHYASRQTLPPVV